MHLHQHIRTACELESANTVSDNTVSMLPNLARALHLSGVQAHSARGAHGARGVQGTGGAGVFRTRVLRVCGFDLTRISSLPGEILQSPGSSQLYKGLSL